MAKQTVNIGVTANDNTGDPLRTAFDKLNDNFDEVYAAGPVGTNLQISDNTIASTNTNGNIDINPAGTGTVILNGPTEANGVVTLNSTVTGNIVPTAANTYTLGSSSAPYKELYVSGSSLHIGNLVLKEVNTMLEVFQADGTTNAILSGNSTTSGTVLNNGNTVVSLTANGPITFFANNYQDVGPTTTVINTSNITAPNVVSNGEVTATGNISGAVISGTGVVSTGLVQGASILSTGNIDGTNLAVTGDVAGSSITSSGNVNVTGDVLATNLWGVLQTADQPNVTGLGTLTDLQVAGDLSMTDPTATIDSYDITANGTVTATSFQSTTGNTSVSDSGVVYTDGTTQTTAFVPSLIWRTSDSSVITSTPTNAFGNSVTLEAGKHYEWMGHLILDNQSTGNIVVGYTETAGDMTEFYSAITAGKQNEGVSYTFFFDGVGYSTTTIFSDVAGYHIQFVGTCTPVSTTNLSINVSNTTGNVVVKKGSSIRVFEYDSDTVGTIV